MRALPRILNSATRAEFRSCPHDQERNTRSCVHEVACSASTLHIECARKLKCGSGSQVVRLRARTQRVDNVVTVLGQPVARARALSNRRSVSSGQRLHPKHTAALITYPAVFLPPIQQPMSPTFCVLANYRLVDKSLVMQAATRAPTCYSQRQNIVLSR